MEFNGVVKLVKDPKSGETKGGEAYKTIDFLVEESEGMYPNSMVFQLFKKGENTKYVDSFASDYPEGTEVTVLFNSKASEYNDKHYNNISAWKIDVRGAAPTGSTNSVPNSVGVEADDDLPF